MPWLQLRIITHRNHVPTVENAVMEHGALSVTFEDNADEPIFEPELGETPLWQDTRVTALYDADINTEDTLAQVKSKCDKIEAIYRWHILEDKDWQREWMKHFKPLQCGENFWICPSWIAPPAPEAINLMLDPGLAFGTGTHPTTFLCLQWIAKAAVENQSVIDYGCGSGILGIAALLHNASSVIGVDIDPQALIATQENVKRNQLAKENFPVYLPEKCPTQKAKFVFANILAGPLVDLAPTLIGHLEPQGQICLSGILSSQKDAIVETYSQYITIDSITEKEEWVCITGTAS